MGSGVRNKATVASREPRPPVAEAVGNLPPGYLGLAWSGDPTILSCEGNGDYVRLIQLASGRHHGCDLAALAAAAAALEQSALLDQDLPAVASRLDAELANAAAPNTTLSGLLMEIGAVGDVTFVSAACPGPVHVSGTGRVLPMPAWGTGPNEPFGRTANRPVTRLRLQPGEALLMLSWQARVLLTECEIRAVLETCARPDGLRPAVGLAVGALWAMVSTRAARRFRPGLVVTALARQRVSAADSPQPKVRNPRAVPGGGVAVQPLS